MTRDALLLLVLGAIGCASSSEPSSREQTPITKGMVTSSDLGVALIRERRSVCPSSHEARDICSAVLIAPRVLLTSAHCLDGTKAGNLEIYFGADATTPGIFQRVEKFLIHPAYSLSTSANDLALIRLAHPSIVDPIALSRVPIVSADVGSTVRMVGFGESAVNVGDLGVKRSGTASIAALEGSVVRLTPSPSISCNGDSGGPVFARRGDTDVAIAITRSGDEGCIAFSRAVDVQPYLDGFIDPFVADAAKSPNDRFDAQPSSDYCNTACKVDGDCPTGMLCLFDRTISRCGYAKLRSVRFGSECRSDAECPGSRCGAFGSGEDQQCRCAATCPPYVAPVAEESGCGWTGGSGAAAIPGALALLSLAGVARRRVRRPSTRRPFRD